MLRWQQVYAASLLLLHHETSLTHKIHQFIRRQAVELLVLLEYEAFVAVYAKVSKPKVDFLRVDRPFVGFDGGPQHLFGHQQMVPRHFVIAAQVRSIG